MILCVLTLGAGGLMALGTLLSLTQNAHWFIRGWDFPRLLIAGIASSSVLVYSLLCFQGRVWEWGFVLTVAACVLWQCYRVFPYTPDSPVTVQEAGAADGPNTFTLLISNVQQDNTEYNRWLQLVSTEDPDVILAIEVNDR